MKYFAVGAGLVCSVYIYAPFLCILTDSVYSIIKLKLQVPLTDYLCTKLVVGLVKNCLKTDVLMVAHVESMASWFICCVKQHVLSLHLQGWTLKVKTVYSSKMLVPIDITALHFLEDRNVFLW